MDKIRQGEVARAVLKFLVNPEVIEQGVGIHSGINVVASGTFNAGGVSYDEVIQLVKILADE